MTIIHLIVGILVSAIMAGAVVWLIYRVKFGSLKSHTFDVMESARKEGETLKKELILEAKDEAIRIKQKSEDEYDVKLRDVKEKEKELQKKESNLDRKSDNLDNRMSELQKYENKLKSHDGQLQVREKEIDALILEQQSRLENISGLSREEARKNLMDSLYEKARLDAQLKIREIRESATLNANKEAKKIIINAIQRS